MSKSIIIATAKKEKPTIQLLTIFPTMTNYESSGTLNSTVYSPTLSHSVCNAKVDSKLFAKCKVKDIACIICCRQVIHVVILWFCVLVVMTMMSLESLMRLQSGRS